MENPFNDSVVTSKASEKGLSESMPLALPKKLLQKFKVSQKKNTE